MGASKLKVIHVIIIGAVLCIITFVAAYTVWIQREKVGLAAAQQKYKAAEAIYKQQDQAETDLAAAIKDYYKVMASYEKMMALKMPPISLQDRLGGWFEYLHELADVLGPKVEAWPKRTGVKLTNSISIPAGVADANQVPTDVIQVPLGTMTVTGSFSQIMAHIRSWNKFDRLVQVDPVSLSGNSPYMTGQYSLTVYIFPHVPAAGPGPLVGMNGGAALAESAAAAVAGAAGAAATGAASVGPIGPIGSAAVGVPVPMKGGMMKGGGMKGGMMKGGMMKGGRAAGGGGD
jgi:Tfp pilus assembly protein PilO